MPCKKGLAKCTHDINKEQVLTGGLCTSCAYHCPLAHRVPLDLSKAHQGPQWPGVFHFIHASYVQNIALRLGYQTCLKSLPLKS